MVDCVDPEPTWMDAITSYLRDETLPSDVIEARKVKSKSSWYVLHNDELYRRSFTMLLLKCLSQKQDDIVIEEVHSGVCGNHLGPRSLTNKILR